MKIVFSRSSVLSLSVPLVRVKLGPILIETSKGWGWGRGNAGIFYWQSLNRALLSSCQVAYFCCLQFISLVLRVTSILFYHKRAINVKATLVF